jgi:ribose/xylose/arabinose/galactoside ABC-type transport system permease subunit
VTDTVQPHDPGKTAAKVFDAAAVRRVAEGQHADESKFRRFVRDNRPALGSLLVFIIMLLAFFIGNPVVFSQWSIYRAVLQGLPVVLFAVVPLVFVVTVGEIDLSFPATMGMAGWAFALVVQAGYDPFLGIIAAAIVGLVLGFVVGWLVVYANLSSLIATLGMNFMLRGVILIFTQGLSMALVTLPQSTAYQVFSGDVYGVPVQIVWAIVFVIICSVLYNRHRFGARVHVVGDNPDAAQQMGINIKLVRLQTYVFVGLGSAFAGVFGVLLNFTWYPTAGDGYLLPALASVFVGGTAPWGGVGTIIGSAIGSLTVSFIQTGVVGVGLSGFYVQFFYGLIIILSLLGHRWNQVRYR